MKYLLFANTDWYLYNFRRSLALALRDSGHEVLLVSPPGPYGRRLEELGLRWVPAPMERRSLEPLRELKLLNWLRSLIVRERVDLVHSFTIKCAVYGSLAARIAGLTAASPARVGAVAGMGYVFISSDLKARILRPVVRSLMRIALGGRNARLVLQNPDDVALFLGAKLVNPVHVRLIAGSGVNCAHLQPSPRMASTAAGRFRILLPARILWDKGVAEYVEASRLLKAAGRDIEFLLAGESDPGNPAAVDEAIVRGWVNEGLVTWLGHVEDMLALYHSVDAVVLPSYREGLPRSLIEAGACALPLVTTDVPGCREVVKDGWNGLLVKVRDAGALAHAIGRLHDDPEMRRRLGTAARERTLAEFDERIVVEKTMAVYGELLQAKQD